VKKRAILYILLAVLSSVVSAQLTYMPIAFKQLDASVCWNVKVQINSGGERVELFGKISDDNGKVLIECESDKMMLRNGLNTLDASLVSTGKIKFHDARVKRYLELYSRLPDGRYEFCTTIKTVSDHEELGDDCISLTQTNTDTVAGKKWIKLPKEIQLYGNASIEHVYSTRQGTDQTMPPHLVRIPAQPGVSVFNVPMNMNFYYTSERIGARPNQFAVSFNFDAQKFKENLRSLIEKKIMEQTKINTASLTKQYEQVAELGSVNDKLKGLAENAPEISSRDGMVKVGD